jgi:hypothetical protein
MTPHFRVLHVSRLFRSPDGVYIGRGPCPCADRGCGHRVLGDFGNPFKLDPADPARCMVLYLDMLASLEAGHLAHLRTTLAHKRLFCWCRGRYGWCHGDPLAYLADGLELAVIRLELLQALGVAA